MKTETQNLYKVAIVGGTSLKGKELKEVLEERNFPTADIKLLTMMNPGQLERVQDEIAVVQRVARDQLRHMDFTFFASEEDFTALIGRWRVRRAARLSIFLTPWRMNPTFPCARPGLSANWGSTRSSRWSPVLLLSRILLP